MDIEAGCRPETLVFLWYDLKASETGRKRMATMRNIYIGTVDIRIRFRPGTSL